MVVISLQFMAQEEARQKADKQHQQQIHEAHVKDRLKQSENNYIELQQLQVAHHLAELSIPPG